MQLWSRFLDVVLASIGLLVASPVLFLAMFLIWLQDRRSPLYIAPRVGKDGRIFRMVKLRSMVVNADIGVYSTSANDPRITLVGRLIRKTKLDEVIQLWNVLLGDMSLVGPRPNVERETALYTMEERRLLSVKPGMSDFSSIVFADESEILQDSRDPDFDYMRLIRPWKSRLGLFYIKVSSVPTDLRIIALTVRNLLDRRGALLAVSNNLQRLGASDELVKIARRDQPLQPHLPPGADVVFSREPAQPLRGLS